MDYSLLLTEPSVVVPTAVAVVSFLYLVVFYFLVYFRIGYAKPVSPTSRHKAADQNALPPVSVVITVHNEGESIRNNLVYLLEQDYPQFEVVVVEYCTHSDTHYSLQILAENYPNLQIVSLPKDVNGFKGRKWPLSIGIQSARYEHILISDVDCIPSDVENFSWIRQMMRGYNTPNTAIVLGYCAVQPSQSFFNWLQQYDNLAYSARYLSTALRRRPFTGNGHNLSYRRSLFLSHNGFIYDYFIPQGDDDIIVQHCATSSNTTCVLDEDAFTTTAPQPTLNAWHKMRLGRTATYALHPFHLRLLQAMYPLSLLLFYITCALLWTLALLPWYLPATLLLVKVIIQYCSVVSAAKRLNVPNGAVAFALFFEIYFLFANAISALIPMSKK